MADYKKCGSVVIHGKKKTLYSKAGTSKKYVTYKERKMNVVKYRKMMDHKKSKQAKQAKAAKSPKVPKVKSSNLRHAKKRGGAEQALSNMLETVGLGNF